MRRSLMSGTILLVLTRAPYGRVAFDHPGYDDEIVGSDCWREQIQAFTGCRAVAQTFRAVTWQGVIDQYARLIGQLPDRVATARFGQDRHAGFKRRFDPDVPDYYVTVNYSAPSHTATVP